MKYDWKMTVFFYLRAVSVLNLISQINLSQNATFLKYKETALRFVLE